MNCQRCDVELKGEGKVIDGLNWCDECGEAVERAQEREGKVAVYSETCVMGGSIAHQADPEDDNDDYVWMNVEDARANLKLRDSRAGGAAFAWAHKAARNVLNYFGEEDSHE